MKDNEREIIANIVDPETGEIYDVLRNGDKIIRPRGKNEIGTQNVKMNTKIPHIKLIKGYTDMLIEEQISGCQLLILHKMCDYLGYNSGLVRFPNNGLPVKVKHLSIWLKRSENAIYRDLQVLFNKGLVATMKNTVGKFYILNPFVFLCGNEVNATLLETFQTTKWCEQYDKTSQNIKE